MSEIKEIFFRQRDFFATGKTIDIDFRIKYLKKLKQTIKRFEQEIYNAFFEDLHKSDAETYATEIGLVYSEISLFLKKIKHWQRPERKKAGIINFKSKAYVYKEPFGVVFIMAPWNYPFLLLFQPLVAAIAAGNTVILKTSTFVPNIAEVMGKIITAVFPADYVAIFNGDIEVNQELFALPFDMIFFTGSPYLGKIVMKKAAEHLTPVVLELGGKSPAIVDENANLKIAAQRLTWGKFLNAGQTCVAPDYLFVHKKIKNEFLQLLKNQIIEFYGKNPSDNEFYGRIVSESNVERLEELMQGGEIFYGGKIDKPKKFISPTIIVNPDLKSDLMQQEIFGPLLPVMDFEKLDAVIDFINQRPKPLALYYFGNDKQKKKRILRLTSSGGVCINDTVMHLSSHSLPFGGVGNSGMGRYHGKYGFMAFSNLKSVLDKTTLFDIPLRYPPYKKSALKIFKWFLK